MSLVELIDRVSNETGKSKKEIREVAESLFQTISKQTSSGIEIRIPGFGRFYQITQKGRTVKAPDGRTHEVAAKKVMKFKSYT